MDLQKRISSIDIARGLVMIIMALDHVRDLLHDASLTQSPTNLATTTPILFFTRWITHLCAPTFVFLAGVSAYISYTRSQNKKENRNFLWKRGIWLIVAELILINFALWFDFQFRIVMFLVIAAIGVGLILVAAVIKVNPNKIGIIALIILLAHNLLQYLPKINNEFGNTLMSIFFRPGMHKISPDTLFFVAYPIIPWVAILLLGFACGRIFEQHEHKQKSILLKAAIASLLLFFVLRFVNIYGDPQQWKTEKDGVFTMLSFFNVTKQPPSLLFISLFLGIMFLLLRFAEKLPDKIQSVISVYGKVPLFYYLVHFYLIRTAVFIMVFSQGFQWKDLLFGPFQFGRPVSGSGISLWAVYIAWILLVILLYPLCKWYGDYKSKNKHKRWLRYL